MEKHFKDDILYIYPINTEKKNNILNHYEPINSINQILRVNKFRINIMSKHMKNVNYTYKSIIVILPEKKQTFENLIYFNFEDTDYLNIILKNSIINILNTSVRNNRLLSIEKQHFKTIRDKREDICRITRKINKILEFDNWPLDTYYVLEKEFADYINKNIFYKFKKKNIEAKKYIISKSITNITLMGGVICVGFGDWAGRFGRFYCIIKNMGFNIIRNKKYSYANIKHTNGKSLFTFYDSPFYGHFKENNNFTDIVKIHTICII